MNANASSKTCFRNLILAFSAADSECSGDKELIAFSDLCLTCNEMSKISSADMLRSHYFKIIIVIQNFTHASSLNVNCAFVKYIGQDNGTS